MPCSLEGLDAQALLTRAWLAASAVTEVGRCQQHLCHGPSFQAVVPSAGTCAAPAGTGLCPSAQGLTGMASRVSG